MPLNKSILTRYLIGSEVSCLVPNEFCHHSLIHLGQLARSTLDMSTMNGHEKVLAGGSICLVWICGVWVVQALFQIWGCVVIWYSYCTEYYLGWIGGSSWSWWWWRSRTMKDWCIIWFHLVRDVWSIGSLFLLGTCMETLQFSWTLDLFLSCCRFTPLSLHNRCKKDLIEWLRHAISRRSFQSILQWNKQNQLVGLYRDMCLTKLDYSKI